MNANDFNAILEYRLERTTKTLKAKRDEYADNADVLSNFRAAANFRGTTMEDALMGMLTKHLVSLSDMCGKTESTGATYPPAVWEEKIGDSIAYLILLEAIVKEQQR